MPRIFSYRKVIDQFTTHCLAEPEIEPEGAERITELCTIDGVTYVAVPDSVELPEQPPVISETLMEVVPNPELVQQIKSQSSHVILINQRVVERIRERYSQEDELKTLRVGGKDPQALSAYEDFVEQCVAWGKAEKAKLGLEAASEPERISVLQTANNEVLKDLKYNRLLKKGDIAGALKL